VRSLGESYRSPGSQLPFTRHFFLAPRLSVSGGRSEVPDDSRSRPRGMSESLVLG
jgi:hypothetical protein